MSSTPVSLNESVEDAGLTPALPSRPKRAGVLSVKVRSADNVAEPALSSHHGAQAGPIGKSPTTQCLPPITPAATSVPNTLSISRLSTIPGSPTTISTSTGLGNTAGDVTDDDGVELLAGMGHRCK